VEVYDSCAVVDFVVCAGWFLVSGAVVAGVAG
jgi:hypothetical protein